jgi:hypothetical protein
MIVNPSPSSLFEMTLLPIQIQIMPNATTIIPATKSGLNSADNSFGDFAITATYNMNSS